MATTAIEWTETTWNPVTGCDRISPGCDHCYALRLAGRLKAIGHHGVRTLGQVHGGRRLVDRLDVAPAVPVDPPPAEVVAAPAFLQRLVAAPRRLERRRWEVRVGPYRLTRRHRNPWLDFYLPILRRIEYFVEVDAEGAGGLPKPGKGENSWDCGQDHLVSMCARVARPHDGDRREWLVAALAKATESVLRDRIRYGSGVEDVG